MKTLSTLFLIFLSFTVYSQTYIWNEKQGDFQMSSNWTPGRTNPSIHDTLIIEQKQGNNLVIINVPTQTIAKLVLTKHSSSDNKSITLLSSSMDTLTIGELRVDVTVYAEWISFIVPTGKFSNTEQFTLNHLIITQ